MAERLGILELLIQANNSDALLGLEQTRRAALGTAGEIKQAFAAAQVALAGIGFVAVARQIADVGIAAEAAGVRLDSLAGRFGEAQQAQTVAGDAARQLNLSLSEAQSGFAQLYASLRPTGVSLQQIETIFVGVTAAAKNTGLGAESVNNALIQLTQGLASGRLQGDELRSVLEQLPPLSQAIARELNVPVGSLKQLGSEGKITTDIIIKALERLKATELGSLTKSLGTSQEAMKSLANATQNLQIQISTLFGSETLQSVRTLTGAVGDLATLVKAAARASKELKENLPAGSGQDSIRTGSLPVDFLIKQSDVISQGKFSNELAFQWKSLIGQAKLYGDAKNVALAAGRYIPPEQQVGFQGGGKTPEQVAREQGAATEALANAQKKLLAPARERLQLLQSTINLSGSDLEIASQRIAIEKALTQQAAAQEAYSKARKASGNDPNNTSTIQAAVNLEVAGIAVQEAMIRGGKALRDAAADTALSTGQFKLQAQALEDRITKAKELAGIEDQAQRAQVAAAQSVLDSIAQARQKQAELGLQLQNQVAKGDSTENIRSTIAQLSAAGGELELALVNGGRALRDQLNEATKRLDDTLSSNFAILTQIGKQRVLEQAQANITRGVQTGLIDPTLIPSQTNAQAFIAFGQQAAAVADAFGNFNATQRSVADAQSKLAEDFTTTGGLVTKSIGNLADTAIPNLVAALNKNSDADRTITVTVNADTGQTFINQAAALS